MAHLVYPTVDLFLYDLRDALGHSTAQLEENRQSFFQKLPTNIHFSIQEKDEEIQVELEADFVELLGDKQITPLDLKSPDYEGYYYPVRLSDTYGLLVDCSIADRIALYPISSIKTLRNLIFQSINYQEANLGETWLVSGSLSKTTAPEQSEMIARECYQNLIPNANWQNNLQGKGQILGGCIFELRQENFRKLGSPVTIEDRIEDNHHVIIIIYPDEVTAEKSGELIDDWLRLFCYRSKIIWAYNESRKIKTYLKKILLRFRILSYF